jgi:hypothetical protein
MFGHVRVVEVAKVCVSQRGLSTLSRTAPSQRQTIGHDYRCFSVELRLEVKVWETVASGGKRWREDVIT